MNKGHILLLAFTAVLLTDCVAHKRSAYIYPDNIPETEKEKLFVVYEKGRRRYEANCAECHGIFKKGKDNIPNFSVHQIDNYTARYMNGDPKNHAVAARMEPEQLHEIFLFLRFRKVNGLPGMMVPDKKAK